MNVVGKVGSIISQGVYSVATPLHPFGGAVDIIIVEQEDGTYRSTPWYVRFGKFQGVLKGAEKNVRILVNGIEAKFHMHLDNSGEAYFIREVESSKNGETFQDQKNSQLRESLEDAIAKNERICLNEHDLLDVSVEMSKESAPSDLCQICNTHFCQKDSHVTSIISSECDTYCYDGLDDMQSVVKSPGSDSEVVLMSGDGHVLLAPISSCEENTENIRLTTPHFDLYLDDGEEVTVEQLRRTDGEGVWAGGLLGAMDSATSSCPKEDVLSACDGNEVSHCLDTAFEGSPKAPACKQESVDTVRCSLGDTDACIPRKETFAFSQVSSIGKDNVVQYTGAMTVEWSADDGPLSSVIRSPSVEEAKRPGDDDLSKSSLFCRPAANDAADGSECTCNFGEMLAHNNLKYEGIQPVIQAPDEPKIGGNTMAGFEISLCGHLLHAGMGLQAANEAFCAHQVTKEDFIASGASIIKNENLIVRFKQRYLPWTKAAPILLGMAAFNLDFPAELEDAIPIEQDKSVEASVEEDSSLTFTPSRRWRLWPILFKRTKSLQQATSSVSNDKAVVGSECYLEDQQASTSLADSGNNVPPHVEIVRTNVPTNEEISSLNLKDGQNKIAFSFSTRVLGEQQVDAHIYLWKWDARIVVSDVDGTITKSDVLGQFMPLFGKDWSQSGVARLFSAIKGNGYQLLFLSARAIIQAYLTRSFLLNLKQDGETLPKGPVVISPNGLLPSLYREVIRRTPHEFKIACLEEIRALFPPDYNPFYAGFGNRETDEISYKKVGIPDGKILIINPKGEVAINRCIETKSYTSLHTLVNDMFPPTSLAEHEDFNSWNYWKIPIHDIGF